MPGSQDTLFRFWVLLRAIPREPRSASTQELLQRLRDEGYDVTDRTVARDLEKLSGKFGYTFQDRGRAKYWFWPEYSRVLDIPGLEPSSALAWLISRSLLEVAMPPSSLSHLAPYFERAEQVLASPRKGGTKLARWMDLFRVVRRGPPLQLATVDPSVQATIYRALLEQKQVAFDYQARYASGAERRIVNPFAAVVREGVIYLVGAAGDYSDPVHFALHRAANAEIVDAPSNRPEDFDLDAYVRKSFAYTDTGEHIRLVARFDKGTGHHLRERPLSDDQVIEEDEDELIVRATVLDGEELRWWLLGFGDQVVVEEPSALRSQLAETAKAMAESYSD